MFYHRKPRLRERARGFFQSFRSTAVLSFVCLFCKSPASGDQRSWSCSSCGASGSSSS